jgi:hypothetical protein
VPVGDPCSRSWTIAFDAIELTSGFAMILPLRSTLVLIAAFPGVEIEVAVLAWFRLSPAPLLRRMTYARDQDQAVSPDRIGAPNSSVRSLDVHGEASTAHGTAPLSIHGW